VTDAADESLGVFTAADFRRGEASTCDTSHHLIDHWIG
jgi:hypothetical protein